MVAAKNLLIRFWLDSKELSDGSAGRQRRRYRKSRHESAELHVTGEAVYIDDIAPPSGLLAGRVHYSPHARARIVSIDLDSGARGARRARRPLSP